MFILMVGNGFLLTLIPVRAGLEGFSPEIAGYLASAYFAGILIGAIQINKVIMGVGHIRAFAFFASIISALTLIQGMWVNEWGWIGLRFIYGLCTAGIFITIESWLLVKSTINMRGVALSVYMTVYYAAQSTGQLFLDFFDPKSLFPFCFAVILASIAVLPLSITKTKAPIVEEHSVMSLRKLLKVSPLAMIGALFAGLILGPIYGLLPVYAQNVDYSTSQIAWIMGAIIFGGLVFQWPIGAVSDKIDRRKVLCGAAIFTGGVALVIALMPRMEFLPFLILTTVLGGFCFVLYPLSISHACDQVEPHDIIAATGGILLAYGIGSIIGPIIASYGIRIIGDDAFFIFLAIVGFGLAAIAIARMLIADKVPLDEKVPYANVPQTTPMAFELDARTDESLEDQTPPETKD